MNTKATTERLHRIGADLRRRLTAIDADLCVALEHDSEERAIQTENDEVLRGMQVEAAEQLAAVDAALSRLESGTYGLCVRCRSRIGDSRLNAVPYTAFCIECARSAPQR